MKISILAVSVSLLALVSADALAGKGAGGAHSNQQRELQQFNERTDADRSANSTAVQPVDVQDAPTITESVDAADAEDADDDAEEKEQN